jgi:L-ascorbate metabolism protein UlaG (beta-lactamase superfamily)
MPCSAPNSRRRLVSLRKIRTKLPEGREPFDDIDVILVTHKDGDHFDAASVIACLRSNPSAGLVAPAQVVDVMRSIGRFAAIAARVHEVALEAGAREQVRHDGVIVDALSLYLEHRPQTVNLAFVVELGGARFVHMGDACFAESEALLKGDPCGPRRRSDSRPRPID